MSRFEEVVNEAIGEVVLGEATFKAETLAEHIAQLVTRAPGRPPRRGDGRGPLPGAQAGAGLRDPRRRSSTRCTAVPICSERGTRRLIGVTAQGMTACPCAQELVAAGARRAPRARTATTPRRSSGSWRPFRSRPTTSAASARCTSAARAATIELDAAVLLEIVEHSMSSEIYELMKRSDEATSSRRPTAARASSRTVCAR